MRIDLVCIQDGEEAISAVSAGVLHGVEKELGINLNSSGSLSIVDHLKTSAIKTAVNTSVTMAISKDESKDILNSGMKNLGVQTVSSYGAAQIGYYLDPQPALQTALHGLNSGISGWVLNQSSTGFISGAMGAMVAKTTMGALNTVLSTREQELYHQQTKGGQEPLTKEKLQIIRTGVRETAEKQLAVSQITAATIAALFKQDPSLAAEFAGITGRNNCLMMIDRKLLNKYSGKEGL